MDFKGLENIKFVIFHVTEPFVWLVRDTKVNTRKNTYFVLEISVFSRISVYVLIFILSRLIWGFLRQKMFQF